MSIDLQSLEKKKASEWSLVLSAMHIPHTLDNVEDKWDITVGGDFEKEALRQIKLYEKENKEIPVIDAKYTAPLISVLTLFLVLFFFQTLLYQSHVFESWLSSGDSSSLDIQKGAVWRAVTALTLHADIVHFLSNAFMGSIIFYNLFAQTGTGLGLFLALLSGIAGNTVNADLHPMEYHSIGALTALFGAFGILAAFRMASLTQALRKRSWQPAAAALIFLSLFGSGADVDFMGHFFGLCCGFIIGLAAGFIFKNRKVPGHVGQTVLVLASIMIIIAAWFKALS